MTIADKLIKIKPEVKFFWFITSMIVFFTDNFLVIFSITLISFILYLLTKSYKTIYNNALYGFIPLVIVLLFLGLYGSEKSDLIFTGIAILKWFALGFSAIVFFVITQPFEVLSVLNRFRIHHGIAIAISTGFRFVPIIIEEWQKTYFAQKARGLPILKIQNLFALPTIVSALSVPLLINITQRTEDMYFAMKLKGFLFNHKSGNFKNWSMLDVLFIGYSFVIIVSVFL